MTMMKHTPTSPLEMAETRSAGLQQVGQGRGPDKQHLIHNKKKHEKHNRVYCFDILRSNYTVSFNVSVVEEKRGEEGSDFL